MHGRNLRQFRTQFQLFEEQEFIHWNPTPFQIMLSLTAVKLQLCKYLSNNYIPEATKRPKRRRNSWHPREKARLYKPYPLYAGSWKSKESLLTVDSRKYIEAQRFAGEKNDRNKKEARQAKNKYQQKNKREKTKSSKKRSPNMYFLREWYFPRKRYGAGFGYCKSKPRKWMRWVRRDLWRNKK